MRTTQLLIELIQFHQNAIVVRIESKRFFKTSQRIFFPVAFVVISQCKITQNSRELIVKFYRTFPTSDSFIVLTSSIPKVSKIIPCFGIIRLQSICILQHKNFFQFIRETIVGSHLRRFLVIIDSFKHIVRFRCKVTKCIINHRIYYSIVFVYPQKEKSLSFRIKSGIGKIQRILDIRMYRCRLIHQSHHLVESLLRRFPTKQIKLESASYIKLIYRERLCYERSRSFFFTQFAKNTCFQLTCFMIVPVTHQ